MAAQRSEVGAWRTTSHGLVPFNLGEVGVRRTKSRDCELVSTFTVSSATGASARPPL